MNRALVWRTIQNSTWLLGGLILLGTAFFLWIGIQVHQHIVVEKPLDQGDVALEPEKIRFSSTLGMMTDAVPPLDLSQSTTASTHTAEFRGADYIKANTNRWYLHVMNVTKPEVIKSYLANRTDRQQFTYFRYVEPKQPERYILVYGNFATVSKALDASKTVKFDLPDSVKVYPQRFSELKKYVNDEVAADLDITNLAGTNKLYQVKLRSVPVPVEQPVVPPSPSASQETARSETMQMQTGQTSANSLSGLPNQIGQTPIGQNSAAQGSNGQNNTIRNAANSATGSVTNNVTKSVTSNATHAVMPPNTGAASSNNQVSLSNTTANTANSAKPPGTPKVNQPSNNRAGASGNKPANNNNAAAEQAPTPTESPRPIADPFN